MSSHSSGRLERRFDSFLCPSARQPGVNERGAGGRDTEI